MNIILNNQKPFSHFKLMNFDHLMQLYEKNYNLFSVILDLLSDSRVLSTITLNNNVMKYEPISITRYTHIFHFYYKYKSTNFNNNHVYMIKPHIIFTLYKDAKLLETKSLMQSKDFTSNMDEKLKTNLRTYFWLKHILYKSI